MRRQGGGRGIDTHVMMVRLVVNVANQGPTTIGNIRLDFLFDRTGQEPRAENR